MTDATTTMDGTNDDGRSRAHQEQPEIVEMARKDNDPNVDANQVTNEQVESAKKATKLTYIVMAVGLLIWPAFIAAVIMAYIKKDDVKGTWCESHMRWVIRTFWFSAMYSLIGFILAFVVVGYFVLLANFIWTIYRVVKGFMRFNDNKEMYKG